MTLQTFIYRKIFEIDTLNRRLLINHDYDNNISPELKEQQRYDQPHKAFTFRMHGFQSVVGPVKGVFDKEMSLNKAREHTLLRSDRPAYVTILSLVRDAAARLPNGEGTRAEICELLKDSQFLAPDVTSAQVRTARALLFELTLYPSN